MVPRGRNRRLTERDTEVWEWIGRWYGGTAGQVTREFAGVLPSRQVVYRRLRALTEMGLLSAGQLPGRRAQVFWVTKYAMELLNIAGTAGKPNTVEYNH